MARKSRKDKQKTRRELERKTQARSSSAPSHSARVDASPPPETYRAVRRGIGFVYYGLLLLVVAVLLLLLLAFIGTFGREHRANGDGPMHTLALFAPVLMIVASVMGFVGKMKCLSVPKETGGRQLVYVAGAFEIVVVLINVAGFVSDVPDSVESKSSLLSLTSLVLFLLFLRQLAISICEPELADKAASVLKIGVALFAGLVVCIVGILFLPHLAIGGIFATFVLGIVGFVSYVKLLGDLRRALTEEQLGHLATRQKRAAKSVADERQQQPNSTVALVAINAVLIVGFILMLLWWVS